MNKNSVKASMKKFKEQMKMKMDLDVEPGGSRAVSERRKSQMKWCQQQRLKLMSEYDDLLSARNSIDKFNEELLEDSKWILRMKAGVIHQMKPGTCDNPIPPEYFYASNPGPSYNEKTYLKDKTLSIRDSDNEEAGDGGSHEKENFTDENINISKDSDSDSTLIISPTAFGYSVADVDEVNDSRNETEPDDDFRAKRMKMNPTYSPSETGEEIVEGDDDNDNELADEEKIEANGFETVISSFTFGPMP